jgi:chorismate lyase / 3-hydroxybenzoate synthase
VQTQGRRNDHDAPLDLQVRMDVPAHAPLARFRFAGSDVQAGDLVTDQAWLGGDLAAEYWDGGPGVQRGEEAGMAWSATDRLLMLTLAVDNHGDADPADASHDCYEQMVAFARKAGYPFLLRLWNYIPQINRGAGDRERYRRFCLGRNLALEEAGVAESDLSAATAIGTHGERMLIHFLAGRSRGIPIENPRQVAAYHYPRIYGPRSPSFARAMAIPLEGGGHGLFVSGTASIVGHETIHPGALTPQIDETIANLQALLGEAARRLDTPGLAGFNGDSLLRVYLRDASQWDRVAERIHATWPEARLAGLEAEICRDDLMAEIEAWHRA